MDISNEEKINLVNELCKAMENIYYRKPKETKYGDEINGFSYVLGFTDGIKTAYNILSRRWKK